MKKGTALISIDVGDKDNQSKDVVVGYAAQVKLDKMKQKDLASLKEISAFKNECKVLLIYVMEKLFEKSPLKYGFVRSCRVFDPKRLAIMSEKLSRSCIHNIISYFLSLNLINAKYGYKVRDQFSDFLENELNLHKEKFLCFNKFEDRLDHFFFHGSIGMEKYPELSGIAQIIFTLSHGQASVERGFSERNVITKDNQSDLTMVSRRIIKDHMRANSYTPETITIDKGLMFSVKESRKAYDAALEEAAKTKAVTNKEVQKKLLDADISDLKSTVEALKVTSETLNKEADSCIFQAEKDKKNSTTLVAKCVALKRKSGEKKEDIKKLEESLKIMEEKRKRL